ncbi:hypothetical protein GCM10010172_41170 [Paractinoplanes ferrugineus]|uniref:Uncharacterized protein n=1 Tax=Paractinoplanes ferrugineus TaxID=113564 RepID=A0A919J1C0_9ACTN|nr:hypothetical protein Afe05nite_39530 [Actinoplanes ferrugineus]
MWAGCRTPESCYPACGSEAGAQRGAELNDTPADWGWVAGDRVRPPATLLESALQTLTTVRQVEG